jgi:TIR domain
MSSLADAPDLVGFFSYSREDDEDSGGKLSKLRERIQAELRGQLGRTKADFRLWQDKTAIAHGKVWEDEIKSAIAESVFFIPIVTPTAVRSHHCKFEFDSFLAREKELGRRDLVFPILYIPVPALTADRWRQDPLLAIIGSRQYEQWQNLRHLDASSTEVALRVEKFCANICRALQQEWLSPEERQQAEAQRVAEADERRRQEAEIKQRADEEERRRKAEAEERRRDEDERRRQEAEDRRRLDEAEAEKRRRDEEQRRMPSEQEARQQANSWLQQTPWLQQGKLWLLPLIGAGVALLANTAALVALSIYLSNEPPGYHPMAERAGGIVTALVTALYGGVAGILIQERFDMPKALAIPAAPAILFLVLKGANDVVLFFVPSVFCVWLAFWLWARKHQMTRGPST